MENNGIFLIELNQALHMPGCPICNIETLVSRRYFRFFLNERINDISSRSLLFKSVGFCKTHAWQCQEMELQIYGGGVKHGILYRWMLQNVLAETLEIRKSLLSVNEYKSGIWPKKTRLKSEYNMGKTGECPACITTKKAAEFHLETLVLGISDESLLAGYQACDGLCLPHFVQALNLTIDKEHLMKLCDIQIRKMRDLVALLESYVNKYDYRNMELHTRAELDAWIHAVAFMVGNKGDK